ncbi:PapD-like protein [Dacryopinax primogenitus]|uniref:PapD-like protein n=1 Tax=Dacryopinax primogenitus (strain DJM 731) TaxID=1858805 RepID=M5GED8_DACPD|nr:PapD-like protein [Dacryopinax primogenitus]EJU03168.1 PapD-like protein [Dacryopinax primogenitus]
MSVELSPSAQLGFNRPFNQIVKRTLYVTNNNTQPVAFKVKTTAPKLYCVRPNSGRIEAGDMCEVAVLLQPMKEDPPLNTKCKDKFLVQTTFITPEREQGSIGELWAVAEKTSGESGIHQQKIRVAYLPPEGDGIPEETEHPGHLNGLDSMGATYETVHEPPFTNGQVAAVEPEAYPIPVISAPHEEPGDETFNQAREEVTQASIIPPPPEPVYEPEPQPVYVPQPVYEPPPVPVEVYAPQPEPELIPVPIAPGPIYIQAPPPTSEPGPLEFRAPSTSCLPEPIVPVQAPVVHPPPPVEAPDSGLLAKYADAQAEIERLRAMLASYTDPALPNVGLRRRGQRSPPEEEEPRPSEETKFVESQPEGVPPLVVIMIALGVFITTYLFF